MMIWFACVSFQIALLLFIAVVLHRVVLRWPRITNPACFVISVFATACFGYAIDFAVQAFAGNIPIPNVVPPFYTWTGMGLALQILAFQKATSRWALCLPNAVNALLAAIAGIHNPLDLYVSAVFVFITLLLFVVTPPSTKSHGNE